MDKKKTLIRAKLLIAIGLNIATFASAYAQHVAQVRFCDRKYEYGTGKDSITLFFNVLDETGNRARDVRAEDLLNYLVIKEDRTLITLDRGSIYELSSGQRIPDEYTFSVLVDLSIPEAGKEQIYKAVGRLVDAAPEGGVYISFFGNGVSPSTVVTRKNYKELHSRFSDHSDVKYFYSALYAKLTEFDAAEAPDESSLNLQPGYTKNASIALRAMNNRDKNILFVFTEGRKRPDDESIGFMEVTDYQSDQGHFVPKVFACYYTENGEAPDIETALRGICSPRDTEGAVLIDRSGSYMPADNMQQILQNFEQTVNDAMYDFAFVYKATDSKVYSGRVNYQAEWKGLTAGEADYTIGSAETPWPLHEESTGDFLIKLFVSILVALSTIIFFIFIMKVAIPFFQAKAFAMKYYKKYEPEENIQRRICHYCKQEIREGQQVVMKCKHVMHVHCWQENGYKCAEYGQNCKTGIQNHIDWQEILTVNSLRDCYQTIAGICAGFLSWLIYEIIGRGGFERLSTALVEMSFTNEEQYDNLFADCVNKSSAFLTIGLLLGFFLSLIFRYNDEYRRKDWKIILKILGLSIFSGIIGMISFAIGANIFCSILSSAGTTYIPWYCSLPGYLLFSVCTTLTLPIKSTIPVKSALIGGLCSAIIGFIVLYYTQAASGRWGWMNMLLDFTIYSGGLGASLITVRMLAERFFLDIKNGARAGQRIPIHKWMNATGGGNKVSIGMTGECEIQMNWENSNKVAKEHAQLFVDDKQQLPKIKPLATGVIYNNRTELPVGKPMTLTNGDTIKIGNTVFQYVETE